MRLPNDPSNTREKCLVFQNSIDNFVIAIVKIDSIPDAGNFFRDFYVSKNCNIMWNKNVFILKMSKCKNANTF